MRATFDDGSVMFAVVVNPGSVTVPVNVGDANGDFKSNDVVTAAGTGLFASEVLSTFERPTIAFVIPETVPENVGDANVAYDDKLDKRAYDDNDAVVAYDESDEIDANKFNALCVAELMGLLTSEVLSTFDKPTMVLSIPPTVPENVGDANVAYALKSGADILLIAV